MCKEDYAADVKWIMPVVVIDGSRIGAVERAAAVQMTGDARVDGVSSDSSAMSGIIPLTHSREVGMARKRKLDPKAAALAETRTLNPRPEAVRDEQFGSSEFFDARDVVQVKYEMVRRVRVDGAPVTPTAAAFGFSRPSFYEAAAAVDRDGLGGLVPAKPGPRRAHKLTDEVIAYAQQLREQDPGMGSAQLADRDRGQVRDQGAPAVGGAGPGPR